MIPLSILSACTVIAGSNQWMVNGFVYLDDKMVLPDKVILTLPTKDYSSILFLSGRYAIYFQEEPVGTPGIFTVIINNEEYIPSEILIIERGVASYNIDLHITKTEDEEPEEPEDPTNIQPRAIAGGPYYGTVNASTTFDSSDSYDSDGTISKYEWDFGDGTKETGIAQNHTYSQANNYRITLTVTDNKGETDLDITYAYITDVPNSPPTPPIIYGTTTGTIYTQYNFTTCSTDQDNDSIRYLIDWGDGSELTSSYFLSTNYTINHSWIYPGIFILNAFAIDEKDVASSPTRKAMLIDTIYCGYFGYMTDYTNDSIYDLFHSNITGEEAPVEQSDGLYLIDVNNDGEYDYQYDAITSNLTKYTQTSTNKENTSLIDLIEPYVPYIIFITAILSIILIELSTHKPKEKSKKKSSKVEEKKKTRAKEPIVKPRDKKPRNIEEEIDKLLSEK